MKSGIVSWGTYIPSYRIKVEEIASVWGQDAKAIKRGLKIQEKAVPGMDEDVATISVESARQAMSRAKIDPKTIGAIYFGSESHPYAVKPTGSIVGDALRISPNFTTADLEFACKAGTAALQIVLGLVKGGSITHGMAGGVDTAQGAPGDPLEYTAAAGGATYIVGTKNIVAEVNHTLSFTTDTPDFWRREHQHYPNHGGAFTGEPAYFRHIMSATKNLLEKIGAKPEDYDYAVFHQPNGKFPTRVALKLGFTMEQIKTGLLVPWIGNTYSGSSLLGLAAVLDVAKPGDRVLVTSYGSGAGSDSFDITVTDNITKMQGKAKTVQDWIDKKRYLSYAGYAKHRKKFRMR